MKQMILSGVKFQPDEICFPTHKTSFKVEIYRNMVYCHVRKTFRITRGHSQKFQVNHLLPKIFRKYHSMWLKSRKRTTDENFFYEFVDNLEGSNKKVELSDNLLKKKNSAFIGDFSSQKKILPVEFSFEKAVGKRWLSLASA